MYESPVHLILQDVESQMNQEIEKTIITVVRKFDVDVDKGEIIKALRYDRNQYTKGYKDGVNETLDKLREEIMNVVFDWQEIGLNDILKILDKYKKSESEEQESCENTVTTHKSLCDSCTTQGCIFQSGVVRNHCDFYKAESEDSK